MSRQQRPITDREIKAELVASVSAGSSGGLSLLMAVNAVVARRIAGEIP